MVLAAGTKKKARQLTLKQARILLWVLNDYTPPRPTAKWLHELVDGKNEENLLDRAYEILRAIAEDH